MGEELMAVVTVGGLYGFVLMAYHWVLLCCHASMVVTGALLDWWDRHG